ncbi:MAG: HAD family hydrolase [Candidatus Riflebacteria bacterium]|nr:HAD family hydrolase [Candidatus Riflebacteria bacterium]
MMPGRLFIAVLVALTCAASVEARKTGHGRQDALDPLEEVVARVRAEHREKTSPVVIFDLDDTLFRVTYRTKQILIDWAAHLPAYQDQVRTALAALDPETMPYTLLDTLDQAGVTDPALRRSALRHWKLFFFSNRYLPDDRPVAGAVLYVNELRGAGARIAYLTGRDRPRMEAGTLSSLERSGLPVPQKLVRLYLKPDPKMPDLEFKKQALADIRKIGKVVAAFDNEPANVNAIKAGFPPREPARPCRGHRGRAGRRRSTWRALRFAHPAPQARSRFALRVLRDGPRAVGAYWAGGASSGGIGGAGSEGGGAGGAWGPRRRMISSLTHLAVPTASGSVSYMIA